MPVRAWARVALRRVTPVSTEGSNTAAAVLAPVADFGKARAARYTARRRTALKGRTSKLKGFYIFS